MLRDASVRRAAVGRERSARGDLGRGFSRRNLIYMREFATLRPTAIVQPLAAQIAWTPIRTAQATRDGFRSFGCE
jgi:hypothetical protein